VINGANGTGKTSLVKAAVNKINYDSKKGVVYVSAQSSNFLNELATAVEFDFVPNTDFHHELFHFILEGAAEFKKKNMVLHQLLLSITLIFC